ncbi:MAG: isoprenylcysteine carboxylmethyltransferase family protein [Chloroflexi bacterium]|nr:isoprenylcysteine carboxylmethyltransferase family protein [Chloroflexota bacterium]
MSIVKLLLSMALWGVVHSLLASHFARDMLRGTLGGAYRLAYNAFAGISFLPILYLMRTLPDQPVYNVPEPWNLVMFAGQGLAALFLLVAFLQTDFLSFVGLRQLFEAETGPGRLVTHGLYRVVRHPLYTFSLLFIWLSPTMTQNSLAVYFGATVYVVIGAYFEERKLLRDFGEAYAQYRQRTPMLIPGWLAVK